MNSFRSYVWDPGLIIGQIICMQSAFYTVHCILTLLTSVRGTYPTLGQIFSAQVTIHGAATQLFTAAVCSVALYKVVGRSKQCLDFACTLHFWHFFFVTLYRKLIPTEVFWWLLQVLSIALCTVLGEYLCLQNESRDIPLSSGSRTVESLLASIKTGVVLDRATATKEKWKPLKLRNHLILNPAVTEHQFHTETHRKISSFC